MLMLVIQLMALAVADTVVVADKHQVKMVVLLVMTVEIRQLIYMVQVVAEQELLVKIIQVHLHQVQVVQELKTK